MSVSVFYIDCEFEPATSPNKSMTDISTKTWWVFLKV